jgi:hypothetical protein
MPHDDPAATSVTHEPQSTSGYEPPEYESNPQDDAEDDDWLKEEPDELPRRPRHRLLGTGGNPIFLALLSVLLIACGFIGGVLVEKGQASSSSSSLSGGGAAAAGLASRFRALREGASSAGSSSTSASGGPSSLGGFTRPTAGTVAYLDGNTLYVTNAEGNTVKVTTSAGTSVSKTVTSTVKDVHPGETVTVTGATGANGTISAESIRVGSGGGGLAALFGGSGASRAGHSGSTGHRSGSSGTGTGSGEPALFGNGK